MRALLNLRKSSKAFAPFRCTSISRSSPCKTTAKQSRTSARAPSHRLISTRRFAKETRASLYWYAGAQEGPLMDFAILDPCLERDFPFTEDGIRVVGDHAGLIGHFVFDAIGGGFPFAHFFKSKLFDFLSPKLSCMMRRRCLLSLGSTLPLISRGMSSPRWLGFSFSPADSAAEDRNIEKIIYALLSNIDG